jgi:flagellar basal body P-ring formation protein FlgA
MGFVKALLVGITMTANLAWARPEVIFPNEAEVSNTAVISVFQVAELKELNGAAFNEIAKMPLADKIETQESLTLSGEEISKKLRDLVKNSEVLRKLNPAFKIPSEIRIKIRQDGLSKIDIERSIRNALSARCGTCSMQIRLSGLPKVAGKSWSIDWAQEIKYGSFMIPVQEDGQLSSKWITGTVRVQKQVPVAKKLIRFGERLQAEDLEMLEADITFIKEETPEMNQVVGLIANRTLTPRAPIVLSDLKREPAARRGQMVKALVGDQNFEVSVNAAAEENGFVGDLIKIKNSETQKTMSAIVIEKGVVRVQ